MDLKAEIEKNIEVMKEAIEAARFLQRNVPQKERHLFTYYDGVISALSGPLKILINLLKHEALQTTEPCMTKEGLVGKGGHTHGEG